MEEPAPAAAVAAAAAAAAVLVEGREKSGSESMAASALSSGSELRPGLHGAALIGDDHHSTRVEVFAPSSRVLTSTYFDAVLRNFPPPRGAGGAPPGALVPARPEGGC